MLAAPNYYVNDLIGQPVSDSTAQTPVYPNVPRMPILEGTPPPMAGNRVEAMGLPQSLQVPEKMAFAEDKMPSQMPGGVDFPEIQRAALFLENYMNVM